MSSFLLKILALISMVIDHVGLLFFPNQMVFRYIGRLSFPIFAFQIVKGFEYTKSREKYITRILLLTIFSQLPHGLYLKMAAPTATFILNIGATFTVGLLLLYVIEEVKPIIPKILLLAVLGVITFIVPFEYGWFGISLILIIYLFKDTKLIFGILYTFLIFVYCYSKDSLFALPAIYALLPIFLYNSKQGPKAKYLFYIFYPLHFLILVGIKTLIG